LYGVLVITGVIGIVFGSWMSFRQVDYKRMLAYSTVAQMGFIAIGIGLNSNVALVGALLLVLVHSFMKAVMFFVAGSVYDATGRKKIPQFAGLGRRMPWTMVGFTVAAASMVGLPPTGGFFSKFYLVLGAAQSGTWLVAGAVVASSLLTLAYFLPIVESIWFKPDSDGPDAPRCESSTLVVLPIAALALGIVVIGIVNVAIVDALLEPMADSLTVGLGL
jgi:multicomponent Na+:H+ antiporter subunit D